MLPEGATCSKYRLLFLSFITVSLSFIYFIVTDRYFASNNARELLKWARMELTVVKFIGAPFRISSCS
jgi:hypothetical protein